MPCSGSVFFPGSYVCLLRGSLMVGIFVSSNCESRFLMWWAPGMGIASPECTSKHVCKTFFCRLTQQRTLLRLNLKKVCWKRDSRLDFCMTITHQHGKNTNLQYSQIGNPKFYPENFRGTCFKHTCKSSMPEFFKPCPLDAFGCTLLKITTARKVWTSSPTDLGGFHHR